MPYTPPSHRSPAASTPASPDASRRPSVNASPRPSIPRSASYLTKHRRTPSAVITSGSDGIASQPTPSGTSDDLKGLVNNSAVRQSPPPITDKRSMPTGAVLSPPDSASSGSDDEGLEIRGRKLEIMRNFRELKDAISQIPLHRESSPNKAQTVELLVSSSAKDVLGEAMHHSFSTGALDELAARRGSRARLMTESDVRLKTTDNSSTVSEEESDDDLRQKPQMVRKKSGELVRPALRPPSRRRPSSMPGTPTFSKAVHFDSHLEHVRHFLQVDRPLAVSAGSSPMDSYESENEFPFQAGQGSGVRSPLFEWEIIPSNFPVETSIRKALPARLEKVWLSGDQKFLLGSVDVANLAFQKYVACRFTLDYWKTTSEVAAEFTHEIRPRETLAGHDRFTFAIKLSDLAHLETKTMYFCIRYNVNGQEFWDNNAGLNFQIDFRKKHQAQNGKSGVQGAASRPANALPRSSRRANPSSLPRPKSMPVGLDDFSGPDSLNFDQPIHEYLGETRPTLRLKNKSIDVPSDNLSSRLSTPRGQAFANRYDFGVSLSAAMQAAKDSMGKDRGPEGLYMKMHEKKGAPDPNAAPHSLRSSQSDPTPMSIESGASNLPGTGSPNSSFASSSYEELVNKYCFFGSKQSSPQIKEGTLKSGQYDGADDGFAAASASTRSAGPPIPQTVHYHAGAAQHHSYPRDPNPYFQHAIFGAYQTSPATSPTKSLSDYTSMRQAHHSSSPSTIQSMSPASTAGGFPPFAGTSPSDFPFREQVLPARFPFISTETHGATAIRG